LKKACLMGIVDAGILSGLNNIQVYSIADEEYSSMFGFVDSEVNTLIGGDSNQMAQIREWYSGYTIGSHNVINPWSFMCCLKRNKVKSYRGSSAYLDTISKILSPHVKTIFAPIVEILFEKNEKYEISPLKTQVNYSNTDWDTTSILHFLVHTGYLTYNEEQNTAFVSIPNKEVYIHWK